GSERDRRSTLGFFCVLCGYDFVAFIHSSFLTNSSMLPIFLLLPWSWYQSLSVLTPAGVPVVMRSPGRKVRQLDRKRICSRRPQIMSLVCAIIASLPFCNTLIERFCGSSISSRVTIHGPSALKVSKPLRMLRVLCMPLPQGSRWLMSQQII